MPKNGTTKTKVASKKRVTNPEAKTKKAKRSRKTKTKAATDADNVPSDKEQSQSESERGEANRAACAEVQKLVAAAFDAVEKADQANIEAGKGLLRIKNEKCYEPKFKDFKTYVNKTYEQSRGHLYYIMGATQAAIDVFGDEDIPRNVSITALGQVARIQGRDEATRARERKAFFKGFLSGKEDSVITVKEVRKAVDDYLGKHKPTGKITPAARLKAIKEIVDRLVPQIPGIEEQMPEKVRGRCAPLFDMLRTLRQHFESGRVTATNDEGNDAANDENQD